MNLTDHITIHRLASPALRRLAVTLGLVCVVLATAATAALAAPEWQIKSTHGPQNFEPGGTGQYVIETLNRGDAVTDGSTIRVTDTLPAGVAATNAAGPGWTCVIDTGRVDCERSDAIEPATNPDPTLPRGAAPVIRITVAIDPGASGTIDNVVTISGGGATTPATDTDPTPFSLTPAGFGIVPGSFLADFFDAADPDAAAARQAGAHPFEMRVNFDFNQRLVTDHLGTYAEPDGHPRTISVKLPRGFVGNPEATPKCTSEKLLATVAFNGGGNCPIASQVGSVDLIAQDGATYKENDLPFIQDYPVYNMVPPRDAVAAFAFMLVGRPVWIIATLDPTDYSIVTTIDHASEAVSVRSAELTLWGVPADSSHDGLRLDVSVNPGTGAYGGSSPATPAPFLTLPSNCSQSNSTHIEIDSWDDPGDFASADSAPMTVTGCENQAFDASLTAQPTVTTPSTPTGLAVDLSVTQNMDPNDLGTPPLKEAKVTLPAGMAISPSAADGLLGCSPAQIGLGTNDDPTCPDASKIGTVELETPVLPDPLTGEVYLATQSDNPFGSLLAMYLVAQGQGVTIKLAGKVSPDPVTGQLTTTFDDNPQLPFSSLHLQLKGGPRAPLVTPPTCGVKTTTADLTSWNEALSAVQSTDTFTISGNCDRGFDPGFDAGTGNSVAGKDAPLVTRFTRADSDEELSTIDVSLPPGLLGNIADLVLCPDDVANAGGCLDSSKIGKATVAAGPGSNPFYLTNGRVYMTGPYKGAPFGLSIVVHAKAGPLDLGNVVVRAAVHVDRRTSALRVVSDPLPTILQGIPLQIRVVDIEVDRSGFTFNPTNCSAMSSSATLGSTGGKSSTKSSRFRVSGCDALPFKPKMTIRVGSRRHTAAGRSTPLEAIVRMPSGNANLRGVKVTLPRILNARLNVINRACTLAEFQADDCEQARAGTAVAVTPLLRDPLRGDVFFVRNGNPLPDMMVALRGQVDIDLGGKITIPRSNRLSTNFDAVPDVPIEMFALRLFSGRRGSVGTTGDLCSRWARRARMGVTFRAQSGKKVVRSQRLVIGGCDTGS